MSLLKMLVELRNNGFYVFLGKYLTVNMLCSLLHLLVTLINQILNRL